MNPILRTDAYKMTHHLQYPPGTEHIYSYLESRDSNHVELVFFGLQMILARHFCQQVTQDHIEEAAAHCLALFGTEQYFNRAGWQRVVDEHCGYIPLEVYALPEGTVAPGRLPLMTMVNTDPQLPWVTNWAETILCQVWYPITVATNARRIKRVISQYCEKTGSEVAIWHLNDFGFRGASSVETAGIGGAAHLTSWQGTDNLYGIEYAKKYYYSGDVDLYGASVVAAEHSTITSWGYENENEAYANMIGINSELPTAIVIDSYDTMRAVRLYLGSFLKDDIEARSAPIVVRPDSGVPWEVSVHVLGALWDAFGGTVNQRGYKVLNPCVRMIYGDGINEGSIVRILQNVTNNGFAAENLIFGMGGALLQDVNRDTYKFAIKCSAIKRKGLDWQPVQKNPATDRSKASKGGRFSVQYDGEVGLYWRPLEELRDWQQNLLELTYYRGELMRDQNFNHIRHRCQ